MPEDCTPANNQRGRRKTDLGRAFIMECRKSKEGKGHQVIMRLRVSSQHVPLGCRGFTFLYLHCTRRPRPRCVSAERRAALFPRRSR